MKEQDMVETGIMEMRGYEVAQKYVRYRYKRELMSKSNTTDDSILALLTRLMRMKQENPTRTLLLTLPSVITWLERSARTFHACSSS